MGMGSQHFERPASVSHHDFHDDSGLGDRCRAGAICIDTLHIWGYIRVS